MNNYSMKINGNQYNAQILEFDALHAKLIVNGIEFLVEFESDENIHKLQVVLERPTPTIPETKPVAVSSPPPPATPTASSPSAATAHIKTPLPGTINDIKVKVGDTVSKTQPVIILEAMKMESEVFSDYAGVVKEIKVTKGQTVADGQVLMTIEI